jgi:hypothetical protein
MNEFRFIKYEATPGEKHLGIATVKVYDKVILRYKIVPTKEGSSYFAAPPSYKITENGQERFISGFTVDSVSDNEDLSTFIKQNVFKLISKHEGVNIIAVPFKNEEEEIPF